MPIKVLERHKQTLPNKPRSRVNGRRIVTTLSLSHTAEKGAEISREVKRRPGSLYKTSSLCLMAEVRKRGREGERKEMEKQRKREKRTLEEMEDDSSIVSLYLCGQRKQRP